MAMIKSFGSAGEAIPDPIDSLGVGGTEDGVGLDGILLGSAIGSVNESLLVLRDDVELERVERVSDISLGLGVDGVGPELVHGCSVKSVCLSSWKLSLLPIRGEGTGAGPRAGSPQVIMESSPMLEVVVPRIASREVAWSVEPAKPPCPRGTEAITAQTKGFGKT